MKMREDVHVPANRANERLCNLFGSRCDEVCGFVSTTELKRGGAAEKQRSYSKYARKKLRTESLGVFS